MEVIYLFIKTEIYNADDGTRMQRDYYGKSESEITSIVEHPYIDPDTDPEPTPEPQPTQLDNIEEGQLIIMEAMADQYEQSVETELTNMEVMATIYEQLLAMEGVE